MSDDMSQRMEQVKQRLQRLQTGAPANENQNYGNRGAAQPGARPSPMQRHSMQSGAPGTYTRQQAAPSHAAPQQPQYMQPVYPPPQQLQGSFVKSRSTKAMHAAPQQDYSRMSLPSQQRTPAYGQPSSRVPQQTRQPQPAPNDIPSTQELHMRLMAQRAQYESGAPGHQQQMQQPLRDQQRMAPPPPPQARHDRPHHHTPMPQATHQPPPRQPDPRRVDRVPPSYASSSTSSAFSEYSEHKSEMQSRPSYQPSVDDDRRAPSVISDLSEEVDDEFDHRLMPPIRKNEYDFVWEGGALGLVLVEDPTSRMPIVKRVSTHVSTAAKYVQEGDMLIYINANNTRSFKMPSLMGMLKDLKKPICMRFRRMSGADLPEDNSPMLPPLEPSEYEFLWEEGSLGMTLGITTTVPPVPYVKRLTGRGNSPHLAIVNPGDELIMINERVCGEMGFEASMDFIKAVPKPSVLRFRKVLAPTSQDDHYDALDATAAAAPAQALVALDESSMYAVQWSDGPFGLTVKELLTDAGPVPVVTRKTGRNTCAGLRRVAVGDILVEIGSMKVTDLGFENATKVLRNIAKPVTLKFQATGE
ncbi:Aste57867_10231 [Aphanomyces stellatus]|uniref:Aste57867_10231 protein n=1 Tax=Aphanomyces stellatus TaxID=120398 RepID=A0A485KQB5_9STRA|nr:hypothetical protein As57867_010192 [Aphanomyces stellatus]VFT87106.1 Aste57867_10231 [Aphanomyces stellatus]